ncbi:glucan biosynthesis protein [Oceanicella sp. SM1341]|uniref:glucan biosynthesis protein n=1 Tax=Oceanicella sp. SM1341 TaxID=1548889 RepID=UPI000E54730F|nr:glucan biosynthesis protein [Oceanicella sp. SM1341]
MSKMSRRSVLASVAGLVAAGMLPRGALANVPLVEGEPEPFDFDRLVARARDIAQRPYVAPKIAAEAEIDKIGYDAHWQIRFRNDASVTVPGTDAPMQLFHPGRFFKEPVRVHLVENGQAREVIYDRSYFDMPQDSPAQALPHDVGFAGLRIMRREPGRDAGIGPDWISFLGASYFRTDGPERQYGLSARGIAINTGLGGSEEFPRFSAFWVGPPEAEGDTVTIWALLEGPSVAGAFRIGAQGPADGTAKVTRVSNRLFFRERVQRLGIAPLTSMYWFSERDHILADEWRPEVHDSDGLALHTGRGERIWRPLRNPGEVRVSSFLDRNPRGFGLIQRDRDFENYQDDGVFYDRRPSAWIEPEGDWGPGRVQLVEIPTQDEASDNIVAFWSPQDGPGPGTELAFDYRITWAARDPEPASVAWVQATRQGQGGRPGKEIPEGVDTMVIDFEGPVLEGLTLEDGVEAVVSVDGGRLVGEPSARPVLGTRRWRLAFDFAPDGEAPCGLRAWLRRGDAALSETWVTEAVTGRARS